MNRKLEARFINSGLIAIVIAVLVFFYIPIITLIMFSFKEGRILNLPFEGWTLDWYFNLFSNADVGEATLNSLIIAAASTLISTAIGLGAAQSFVRFNFRGKYLFQVVAMAPLVFPQLLLGVVLLLWFSVLGNTFDFSNSLITAIAGKSQNTGTTVGNLVQKRGNLNNFMESRIKTKLSMHTHYLDVNSVHLFGLSRATTI